MSQLEIFRHDKRFQVHFCSLLKEQLQTLISNCVKQSGLVELRLLWKRINGRLWFHVFFACDSNYQSPEELFLKLFTDEVVQNYLHMDGNGVDNCPDIFQRCGSIQPKTEPTIQEMEEYLEFREYLAGIASRTNSCIKQNKIGTRFTEESIYNLGRMYGFNGGSWVLFSYSQTFGELPDARRLTTEERNVISKAAFSAIVENVLTTEESVLHDMVWRISFSKYDNKVAVVKVSNHITHYFSYRLTILGKDKDEICYYQLDTEVRKVFEKLHKIVGSNMKYKYKPEILSVLNINAITQPELIMSLYSNLTVKQLLRPTMDSSSHHPSGTISSRFATTKNTETSQ